MQRHRSLERPNLGCDAMRDRFWPRPCGAVGVGARPRAVGHIFLYYVYDGDRRPADNIMTDALTKEHTNSGFGFGQ